jgi:N-acetylneuraminic acid mutarotase
MRVTAPCGSAIGMLCPIKSASLLVAFFLITYCANAQTGQWVWMSGSNTTDNGAVYGTKGTPSATTVPGNKDRQSGWKDASGNFWIFGGTDYNTKYYNDLWEYKPATGQWTWVSGNNTTNNKGIYGTQGLAAAANVPGSRNGQSAWIDASGNFWIFGGMGYDKNGTVVDRLNDLWKYNPTTGQWTWVSGSSTNGSSGVYGTKGTAAVGNVPGARRFQSAWVDGSGNFWIFGGYGYDKNGNQGSFDDLWKYNPTLNVWTWMSGSSTMDATGVYGTKGTAAAANVPGGRDSQSGWMDLSGNFWIFGGWDWNNNTFNDLWKYTVATGQWTWESGDKTQNSTGIYGTKGTPALTNKPGGRFGQINVVDAGGNFWIFGGQGYDGAGNLGALNDLLGYVPSTGTWTWSSGDNTVNSTGVYGTKGTAAAANKPGGRSYPSGWTDASDDLWIFGGQTNGGDDFNDLWKFAELIPLAIQEVTLEGINRSGENILTWQTARELNTVGFGVERSTDGNNFSIIGNVASFGSGDNSYSFTDDKLPPENNLYYRLRMEDIDGSVTYSRIIVLSGNQSTAQYSVFPNPAINNTTLQVGDNSLLNTPAKLFDEAGRLVAALQITNPQQYIDLSHVPKGICFLRLSNGKTIKILKE